MKETIQNFLSDCVMPILFYAGTGVLIAAGLVVAVSIPYNSHGSGEMDAYVVQVNKVGKRVRITAKDSMDATNTYSGCVASQDEQAFKDIIGKKARLSWKGVFSLRPLWAECPDPVQIEEVYEQAN